MFFGRENSKFCDRVCCSPHHSLLLHVSPAHDVEDVYFTIERKGCECSKCCCSPKPCLPWCSCSDLCTEEVIVHDGGVFGEVGKITNPHPVVVFQQPKQCCKSHGCTPTIHVLQPDDVDALPIATITGPRCFGGCSEFCFRSDFEFRTTDNETVHLTHLLPRNCGEWCKVACTDSDNYAIEFPANATPDTRAQALASAFLIGNPFLDIARFISLHLRLHVFRSGPRHMPMGCKRECMHHHLLPVRSP